MADQITEQVKQILGDHEPKPLQTGLAKEVDSVVEAAKRELG
jgi:hypothetical protein